MSDIPFDPMWPLHPGTSVLTTTGLRDLSEALDELGRLRVMPASFYQATQREERAWFGLQHGFYSLPTIELADWLKNFIGSRSAIEIGAGNGVLAEHLKIPATDSCLQQDVRVQKLYAELRQAPVTYGANVVRMEALAAVKHFKPQVVIGCWITHRWNPRDPRRGGNMYGPDTLAVLDHCEQYIHIGNEQTHALDPLWSQASYRIEFPDWLYSRANNNGRNFIAIWQGEKG